MQGAISCSRRRNLPGEALLPVTRDSRDGGHVRKLVEENAVIVIGRRGCCMCHVAKMLLLGLGVNPAVLDVDEDRVDAVIGELATMDAGDENSGGRRTMNLPAVYVGGKYFGGLERVMATHISGELIPILKEAGALWL